LANARGTTIEDAAAAAPTAAVVVVTKLRRETLEAWFMERPFAKAGPQRNKGDTEGTEQTIEWIAFLSALCVAFEISGSRY
jgi:hypothetical protein